MDPEQSRSFRLDVERWVTDNPVDIWSARYKHNERSFLDTRCWGADHDFGDGLVVEGAMADRHLSNLARITGPGGIDPTRDVQERDCCVVGCWCGEELLLLDAMGARSCCGVEEVPEYAEWSSRQLRAWGVEGRVFPGSIFSLDEGWLHPHLDFLFLSGMLYHVTDMVTVLALSWATIRPGGRLAVETSCAGGSERQATYLGALRPGWNWWAPSPGCVLAMLADCGFEEARQVDSIGGRVTFVAVRGDRLPLVNSGSAGFSRPDLRGLLASLARG